MGRARGRRLACVLLGASVAALLLAVAAVGQPGWLVYGNNVARTSSINVSLSPRFLKPAWYTPVSGRISSQALVAENMPSPGRRTVYVATSKGVVYALAENGYIRWRVELGQLDRRCTQIDGYGITGTPAIDPVTNALFIADAFGQLHALDLATGEEQEGWPVELYPDFRQELVWGALTIVGGAVYLGTGAYCDRPMEGKVIRADIATRDVSSWVTVPARLGGGGGVWGWGGIAYSARRHSFFVATGNAFEGGSNTGKRFRESAGFGEHLVELRPDLSVRASNHPHSHRKPLDLDFAGSPVLFRHRTCGGLAAILNKDGFLYVWRSARITRGPVFSLRVARPTLAAPLLSQLAYSPQTKGLYASTPTRLVRIDVSRRCQGTVKWSHRIGSGLMNSSPTVARKTVWLVENKTGGSALLGLDARSGVERFRAPLAGPAFVAPTVAGNRLYVGTYTGGVQGFALAAALRRGVGGEESELSEHSSYSDELHGWASREDGVYATEDGGQEWRLIYPHAASRVARISERGGMVAVGDRSRCGCRPVRLWTNDDGAHWERTQEAVGEGFVAAGGTLWWWRGGRLYRAVAWPPRAKGMHPRQAIRLQGAIVDAGPIPGGVAALVSRRVGGLGFDTSPRLVLANSRVARVLDLPAVSGEPLVRSLEVSWPLLRVRGYDFTAFTRGDAGPVTWETPDGGMSWRVTRG